MEKIEQALVERMVALVRAWANDARTVAEARQLGMEARAIVAELPKPVDPDLIEAMKLIADGYGPTRDGNGSLIFGDGPARVEAIKEGRGNEYWEVRVVASALKRGRELAAAEHVCERPHWNGKS